VNHPGVASLSANVGMWPETCRWGGGGKTKKAQTEVGIVAVKKGVEEEGKQGRKDQGGVGGTMKKKGKGDSKRVTNPSIRGRKIEKREKNQSTKPAQGYSYTGEVRNWLGGDHERQGQREKKIKKRT